VCRAKLHLEDQGVDEEDTIRVDVTYDGRTCIGLG
jgi:hypothetical protein